jgi:hypothetical protein
MSTASTATCLQVAGDDERLHMPPAHKLQQLIAVVYKKKM